MDTVRTGSGWTDEALKNQNALDVYEAGTHSSTPHSIPPPLVTHPTKTLRCTSHCCILLHCVVFGGCQTPLSCQGRRSLEANTRARLGCSKILLRKYKMQWRRIERLKKMGEKKEDNISDRRCVRSLHECAMLPAADLHR